MSSNKPKDEADRLAEAVLGQIDEVARNYDSYEYGLPLFSEEESARMREVIAAAIREAIEVRDRIMTDMLSESEAFCEGWRQGAAAQREEDDKKLRFHGWSQPQLYLDKDLVQPPSHDDSGEPLAPSPVHLRAARMEKALLEIATRRNTVALRPMQSAYEMADMASAALEESING